MTIIPRTSTIELFSQFECIRQFDESVTVLGEHLGESELIGFNTDSSHMNGTRVMLGYTISLKYDNWCFLEQGGVGNQYVPHTIDAVLKSCFDSIPGPMIVMEEIPGRLHNLRVFYIGVRVSPMVMQHAIQQRPLRNVFEAVGPNLWTAVVKESYYWTLDFIRKTGRGEYTDMSTEHLPNFSRFKRILDYLVFKTNLDPENITTDLVKRPNHYEWIFNVPNVKQNFALRVLVPEVVQLYGDDYSSLEVIYSTNPDVDFTKFVFRFRIEILDDVWCNNSIAAVHEVLGGYLTRELLNHVHALPDINTILANRRKFKLMKGKL